MDFKATLANGYRNRLLLITVGALLYAGWAYYDATIKYPDQIKAWTTYRDLQTNKKDTFREEWPAVAEENGWDINPPSERDKSDIATQWVQFAIVFPIGSYCLISLLLWSRRYVGCDSEKLYAHGGTEVPFGQITKIDATRWDTKGIALVHYDIGQGEKTLKLDDWKYERAPSDEVFERLVDQVDDEKIIGFSKVESDDLADSDAADDGVA